MDVSSFISNSHAVTDFYRRWPSFHDAQVISYEAANNAIDITLHTWCMTSQVDDKGYFVLKDHSLVTLRFEDIFDVEMTAFGAENILDELKLTANPSFVHVELDSVMDKSGSFSARSGRVVAITPCTAKGVPVGNAG